MKKYIIFIIGHRIAVVAVILLLTVVFGGIVSTGVYSSSIGKLLFSEDHRGYNRYRERIREFANDETVIVIYREDNLFAETSLARLEDAVDEIKAFPLVRRIDSLLNAQHTYGKADTLHIDKYAGEALKSPENARQVLQNIQADPMYADLLVSGDGRHAAVMIELEPVDELAGETVPPLVNDIMVAFEKNGFRREHLYRVGFTSTMADVVSQTEYNIGHLFPYSCAVLLLIVYVMFHRFWPVFVTAGVSFIGVVWTYGFAVILDPKISVFISITPSVIMIVATSDIVHLCSAYLLELARGREKEDAILVSGTEVGTACFWTSVTTFIGFVSLSFVPVPVFRQLGVVLGFGVAVSLILAMTLTPILFSIMKRPDAHTFNASRVQKTVGGVLAWIEHRVLRFPKAVVAVFVVVIALSVFGSSRINIDTDFYKRFTEDSRTRMDEAHYHRHFAGANFLEIFIDAPDNDGILDPEVYSKIVRFQAGVENLPEVDDALSLVNLIGTIDREMNPEYSPNKMTAWTRPLLAQYLLLFESSGGEDLDRVLDFDRKTVRMNVRLAENGTQFTFAAGNKVGRIADDVFGDSAKAEISGLMYLLGGFVDDVVSGQRRGLVFAFFTIMTMMIVVFKSFKIGLLSMFPNVLPLLFLGGWLGLFWDAVDSDTIIIGMVAIGIGVDDTIHFLSRLRFESAHAANPDEALKGALHFSGRAMVTTTVILSAGFLPFALSDYFSVGIFGTLLPMTLIVAVLGDILLAPAMAKLGAIRFPQTATRSESA